MKKFLYLFTLLSFYLLSYVAAYQTDIQWIEHWENIGQTAASVRVNLMDIDQSQAAEAERILLRLADREGVQICASTYVPLDGAPTLMIGLRPSNTTGSFDFSIPVTDSEPIRQGDLQPPFCFDSEGKLGSALFVPGSRQRIVIEDLETCIRKEGIRQTYIINGERADFFLEEISQTLGVPKAQLQTQTVFSAFAALTHWGTLCIVLTVLLMILYLSVFSCIAYNRAKELAIKCMHGYGFAQILKDSLLDLGVMTLLSMLAVQIYLFIRYRHFAYALATLRLHIILLAVLVMLLLPFYAGLRRNMKNFLKGKRYTGATFRLAYAAHILLLVFFIVAIFFQQDFQARSIKLGEARQRWEPYQNLCVANSLEVGEHMRFLNPDPESGEKLQQFFSAMQDRILIFQHKGIEIPHRPDHASTRYPLLIVNRHYLERYQSDLIRALQGTTDNGHRYVLFVPEKIWEMSTDAAELWKERFIQTGTIPERADDTREVLSVHQIEHTGRYFLLDRDIMEQIPETDPNLFAGDTVLDPIILVVDGDHLPGGILSGLFMTGTTAPVKYDPEILNAEGYGYFKEKAAIAGIDAGSFHFMNIQQLVTEEQAFNRTSARDLFFIVIALFFLLLFATFLIFRMYLDLNVKSLGIQRVHGYSYFQIFAPLLLVMPVLVSLISPIMVYLVGAMFVPISAVYLVIFSALYIGIGVRIGAGLLRHRLPTAIKGGR